MAAVSEKPESASVAEDQGKYEDEEWRSSFDDADAGFVESVPAEYSPEPEEEDDSGPIPSLEEVLGKVSARNQELIEGLFRGRFVNVQRLNRKNLY